MSSSRPRILFIMQLPPPVHGVSVMNKIIADSALLNSDLECDYVNLATARHISDLQKASFAKVFITLKIFATAFSRMAFRRYRYVYVTVFPWGPGFLKDSLVVLAAKFCGQRAILHLHTYGFRSHSSSSRFKKWYYRKTFKGCHLICLTPRLIEDVEELADGPVFILPNGLPQVNFSNTYRAMQQPFRLLYLSNLISGKGILLVLESAKILRDKGIDAQLHIAGPEGDVTYAQLELLATQYGIRNLVHFHGPVYGEKKLELYREAGVFLLPSNYDTFGLVLLEAMQFGVPCVSSAIGGIPDVLGEGRGVLLRELTSGALADAVEDLVKNVDKRQVMSGLAFHYFRSNFTVEKFEERLLAILKGTASAHQIMSKPVLS